MANKLDNLRGPRWKKGESGNPKGRPRKYVTDLKIEGYKLSQINDAIIILIRLTKPELTEIAKSNSHTVLEVTIAKAILKDMDRGQVLSLESVLSRVFGRPKNEINANISGTSNIVVTKIIIPDNEISDEDSPRAKTG